MKMHLSVACLGLALALGACNTTRRTAGAEQAENCSDVMCTKMFASVSIHITDAAGNPVVLEEAYTTRVSSGETIRYERSGAANGYYTVLDDSYRKMLSGKTDEFRFTGLRDGKKAVEESFRIGADCCHVSKQSGKAEVILRN